MSFPLILLPKRFAYVEDDQDFLELLRMTLSRKHSRMFFEAPQEALATLRQEVNYWDWLTRILSQSHRSRAEGKGEAALYVSSYFNDWRRFNLASVLAIDNGMPGMDGIQLIEKLSSSPARRVLLTGEADADFAVNAFNAGLIDKFIAKSSANLYQDIARCSEEMHLSVCEYFGQLIRPTLTGEQLALLHNASVAKGLLQKIKELGWTEYVTVGEPFGLLGMAPDGPLQWMQIETPETMQQLAEAGESYEYPADVLDQIRSGSALANWELSLKLDITGGGDLAKAESVCSDPPVLVGVSDLSVEVLTLRDHGIDDVLSPSELMRSLLRDARLAYQQVAHSNASWEGLGDAEETFVSVIRHVTEAADLSANHELALRDLMAMSPSDDPVRVAVGLAHSSNG
jgi:CheY-like chemotaxis protein